MTVTDLISQKEIVDLFGDAMPVEAAQLLWGPENNLLTLEEKRVTLKKIAAARPAGDVEVGDAAIDLLAKALAGAELNYRDAYQRFGGSDTRTGRAWDKMRNAGDAIREHFYQAEECADAI